MIQKRLGKWEFNGTPSLKLTVFAPESQGGWEFNLARAPFGFHAILRSDMLPSGKLT